MSTYDCVILTDIAPGRFWSRSIGAYRIASELRSHGFTCKVINGFTDFSSENLFSILKDLISNDTLFLGVSTTFLGNHNRSGKMSGERVLDFKHLEVVLLKLKTHFPKLKIISGGAKAHKWRDSVVDYFISGYADSTIVKFAKKLRNNLPIEEVQSHLTSQEEGFNFSEAQTHYRPEDGILKNECLVLEITRGCRFRCKFCSYPLNGRKKLDYYKGPDVLRKELIYNFESFGITTYILSDDTYNETPEKIETYLRVFESLPFKIQFSCYLRLDLLERFPKTMDLLLKSGLRGAFFGIESLNDKSAFAVGKALGAKRVLKTLQEVKSSWGDEVSVTGSFIVGLPYDDESELNRWLPVVTEPSFPLDHVRLNPLFIYHKSASPFVWKSEFDLHPEKYGYEVELSEDPEDAAFGGLYWKSPHLDSRRALKITKSYMDKYFSRPIKYDNFHHATIMGYGFSHEKAYQLNVNDPIHSNLLQKLVAERIQEYGKIITEF